MEHEQVEKSDGMFKCKCGYTSGTQKAMDRHIKNATAFSESQEPIFRSKTEPSVGSDRMRQTICVGSLDRPWPALKTSTSEPFLRKGISENSTQRSEELSNSSVSRSKMRAATSFAEGEADKGSSRGSAEAVRTSPGKLKTSFGMSIEIAIEDSSDQPSSVRRSASSASFTGASPASVLDSPRTPAHGLLPPVSLCQPDLIAKELSGSSTPIRLLIVRHAQSANRDRLPGETASSDPELSDRGFQQADALGERLAKDFKPKGGQSNSLLVVSSPMRRCILTIRPAVQRMKRWLSPHSIITHGSCYEYGCAGKRFGGTPAREIVKDFPEFEPVAFGPGGYWDYRGDSPKETEAECRARGEIIKAWLQNDAAAALLSQNPEHLQSPSDGGKSKKSSCPPTVILCIHQTIADLLCHMFVDGSGDGWKYGDIEYKLDNTGITEIFLHPDGPAFFGELNDHSHVFGLPKIKSRRASNLL